MSQEASHVSRGLGGVRGSQQHTGTLPIRVSIADDHPITRQALRYLLQEQDGILVVGEASSGREVIDLVRDDPPDVLVLDIDMTGLSGVDALSRIKAKGRRGNVRVLILSGYPEETYGVCLMRLGASGYLNKCCAPAEIIAAVRHVATSGWHITPLMADLLAEEAVVRPEQEGHGQLSARELQVLRKYARGQTAADAARELSLSAKTVASYATRLKRKLHARSAGALTHYALTHRLVT